MGIGGGPSMNNPICMPVCSGSGSTGGAAVPVAPIPPAAIWVVGGLLGIAWAMSHDTTGGGASSSGDRSGTAVQPPDPDDDRGGGGHDPDDPRRGLGGASDDDWSTVSGIVRNASAGKGNFGLGSGSSSQAEHAGRAWVGDGYRTTGGGETLISKDGLRQWRAPSYKPKLGKWQSNFESRTEPSGRWQGNGHLDITDLP
jgi:hypothetical protein